MSDLISREYMKSLGATCIASRSKDGTLFPIVSIDELQPADPTHPTPSNTLGALDCVERQKAIDALDEQITQCDKALGSFDISMKDEYAVKVERASLKAYRETLNVLPSAQPEIIRCKDCKHYMQTDTIHHRGWCWRWNHFTAIERYCSERALRGDSDEVD